MPPETAGGVTPLSESTSPDGPRPARILCVADEFPWPANDGYRLRLANVLTALGELGEVHLFSAVSQGRELDLCTVPPGGPVARSLSVHRGRRGRRPGVVAGWAWSPLPRKVLWQDWDEVGRTLERWAAPPYDLVWYSHIDVHATLGSLVPAPAIVDLDNLEDHKLRHRRRALSLGVGAKGGGGPLSSLRRWAARGMDRVDEKRWTALQEATAASVAAVTVCSHLDLQRLGTANASMLPNGYEIAPPAPALPEEGEGTRAAGSQRPARVPGPVLAMVGLLTYEPNADAARFAALEILPALRRLAPTAELRLIGHFDDRVGELAGTPGLTITGQVASVTDELAQVDVALVPIRFGGGTRIKILEAFAHGIPVVSTTIGCEGLDVSDGVHLLVADDPEAFAAACVRVAGDDALRSALTAAAHELYAASYRWIDIRQSISRLASDVVLSGARSA